VKEKLLLRARVKNGKINPLAPKVSIIRISSLHMLSSFSRKNTHEEGVSEIRASPKNWTQTT
jgi:hypothetical protein